MPHLAPTPAQATTPPSAADIAAAQKVLAQLASQSAPVELLQARASELSQQLQVWRAQRQVLGRRVTGMPQGDVRGALETQKAQLDNQITQVEMQLEGTRAQIASRLGVSPNVIGPGGAIVIPQQYTPRRGPDPDMVVGMSFTLAICIGLPLAIAYARRIWKGTSKPAATGKPDESASRLERLEHAVDAVAIEIERVAEGQRFVTKILAERPATVAAQRAPAVELQDAALGEAKPFLALGAGPMEQIRVGERQSVMQSITPH